MKQVVQTQSDGKVRVEDVPEPTLRPGGVLVRTAYSLVSAGTERAKVELAQKSLLGKARAKPEQVRQILDNLRDQGLAATYRKVTNRLEALQPIGYSSAGVVVAVGDGVGDLAPGDRVACAGAGYANHAEYVFVPQNLCVRVPAAKGETDVVRLEDAAFATLGAIALHGVRQADVRLGENVAVIGLGLVGLLTMQILKASGCLVVGMDLNAARCCMAKSLGCDSAESDPNRVLAAVQELTAGVGADAVILTAASRSDDPIILAGRICRDRGRVVVVGEVGMGVPRFLYYEKELELRISRSCGPGRYDPEYEESGRDYPIGYIRWTERRNLEAFLRLVADGKVRVQPLITHQFAIERAADAYDLITQGTEPYLGVLLRYDAASDAEPEPARVPSRVSVRESASVGGIGVGLIGCGNFAQDMLLPALRAESTVRLRGVVSASGITARSVAQRFGFEYAVGSADDILNDANIQAVVIATRHDSHAPLVVQALAAGKHVFVEKPLALTQEQLDSVEAAYRSQPAPPVLMVGFNRRFAPSTQVVRQFFAGCSEPLSLHYRVNAGFLPPTHWLHDPAAGGGRLIGEGCHFLDLMICLAGSDVVEVFARALPDQGRYRQDNVVAHLRFANGSLGVLQYLANGDQRVPKERLEVFGGGATAVLDDFRDVVLSRSGRVQRQGGFLKRKDKGHKAEIHAFLEAVCGGGSLPIPLAQMVASTAVTFAVQESIRTGEAIPLDVNRRTVSTAQAGVSAPSF